MKIYINWFSLVQLLGFVYNGFKGLINRTFGNNVGNLKGTSKRSNYATDKYISEGLSKLTNPLIERVRNPQASLQNLTLSQIFHHKFDETQYPLVFSLFRKVIFVSIEYNNLCERLLNYDTDKRGISEFAELLNNAEIVMLYCGQIIDNLNLIMDEQIFDKNDKSAIERLYKLHNQVKHIKTEIDYKEQMQVLKFDNKGIYTTQRRIEYEELHASISDFIRLIERITDHD